MMVRVTSQLAEWASEHERPTLESIPQLTNYPMIERDPFAHIVKRMQITGFQTWGFIIYRCSYSDDTAWERYMDEMKKQARGILEEDDMDGLLLQYLKYTVIEDPSLDGASKNDVRKRFRHWVRNLSRDEIGVDPEYAKQMQIARFSHCIAVDKACLDTLSIYESWRDAGEKGLSPLVACAVIDVACTIVGKGPPGYPEIEGCTRQYPGWMYLSLDSIPQTYNLLSWGSLREDPGSYARPPLIYPGHRQGYSVPN